MKSTLNSTPRAELLHAPRYCLSSLFAVFLLAAALPAQAVLTIRITQGIEGAQPIAIVPFGLQGAEGTAAPPTPPPQASGEGRRAPG